MHRLAITGSFIRDHIILLDGSKIDCIGGLYHSVAFAALLAGDRCTVHPVARVGKDFWKNLTSTLQKFPAVRPDALVPEEQQHTQVTLTYRSKTDRDEMTTETMRTLTFRELDAVRNADALLVNLISGDDVSLEALREFRRKSNALIYLDLHSHTLGIDESGRRFSRKPDDWKEWAALSDFVQLNETEASCLMDVSDAQNEDLHGFRQFIKRILKKTDVRGINITLGERGVLAGERANGKKPEIKQFPAAIPASEVKDIIGCGDAFGAAFLVNFLENRDFFGAVAYANRIAGLNATTMGSITEEKFNRMTGKNAIA